MSSAVGTALTALGAVFLALGLLSLALFALRALGREKEAPRKESAAEPELIAVLSAAAAATLGRPVRIHAVHVHHEAAVEDWSRAGRLDVMISRQIGRK